MTYLDLNLRSQVRDHVSTRLAPRGVVLLVADALALVVGTMALPRTLAIPYSAVALGLLAVRGCHITRFSGLTRRTIGRIAITLATPAVAFGLVVDPVTSQALLRSAAASFGILMVLRTVAIKIVNPLLARRGSGQPTLILGAGTVGVRIARHLLEHPEFGLQPVGFLDRLQDTNLPLPILGDASELSTVADRVGARQVIVAYGQVPEDEMVGIMRSCQSADADVWVVPRFFELGLTGPRAEVDELWGIPMTRAPQTALRTYEWRLKRVFDVVASAVALLLLAPVMAAIAAAVKLSSPGPVFFRQQRVGQGGRTVEVLKFRSLRQNDDDETTWNVTSDDRVTWVGRLIRPSSLDEIPQFFNVLRGDMSLVGPRPERPFFVAEFSSSIAGYDDRHRVPAGLTGLAQVNGLRGDTSIEDRARFDNAYIENWSLWGDIGILFRTVLAVVRPPKCVRIEAAPSSDAAVLHLVLTPRSEVAAFSARSSERVLG